MPNARRSPWARHVVKWSNCRKCDLCNTRRRVVLLRGALPARLLFVGEGPGESEDSLGQPFIGPSGNYANKGLDFLIHKAGLKEGEYAITNLVGCIPRDEATGKAADPPKFAIEACMPRVVEILIMCRPKVVVCVGKHSEKFMPQAIEQAELVTVPTLYGIIHPGAVLKMNASQKPLARQRAVTTIEEAIEEARTRS